MQQIYELIRDFKCSKPIIKVNKLKIPVTVLKPSEDNVKLLDSILLYLQEHKVPRYVETPSGGISIKFKNRCFESWGWNPKWRELTLLLIEGNYRIQLVNEEMREHPGRLSWAKFVKDCNKLAGINIEDYALTAEEGEEVKKSVPKPIIKVVNSVFINKTFDNCHHIDFNSSYPSALIKYYPEFKPVLQEWYSKRQLAKIMNNKVLADELKAHLVNITGCMYGKTTQYRYSHLAKVMIQDNNDRIYDMCQKLSKSGRMPIGINTDGIWYTGPIYHDENEGNNLGQWKNDHVNCKLRYKSDGIYEYIERGEYHAVVRRLEQDKIADSEKTWGMIYKDELMKASYAEPYIDKNNYHRLNWRTEYIYEK